MGSPALDVRPITTLAEREMWNDLVARSSAGHRHQCLWWMEPLQRYGFQSTALGCWMGSRLVGGALVRSYRVPFTLSTMSECLDGPIFLEWDTGWAARVLDGLEALATRSRSMAVSIRDCPHPGVHHDLKAALASRGHSVTSTPGAADAILGLEGRTLEEVFGCFNRGTRARIRKTLQGPLRVRRLSRPEDLASAYRAWIATANRKSFTDVRPWPGLEPVLRHCVDHGLGSIFGTYLDDQLLAAVFIVHVGQTAAYVYGGYMDGAQQHSPTHILQYEAIRESIEKGMRAYNFGMLISEGRSTERGVDDFKLGFGAKPHRHLDTIVWRRNRLLYTAIERARQWRMGARLEALLRRSLISRGAAMIAIATAGTLGACRESNRSAQSRLPGVEQPGDIDSVEPRVDTAAARLEAVLLESTPPAYVPALVWDVVRRYYDARRYAPRWVGLGGLTEDGRALVSVLCALEAEGLVSPVLSDLPEPGSTRPIAQSAADLGELDLRLTTALLSAANALSSGQVNPDSLASGWHVAAPETISDTAAAALLADSAPARALPAFRKDWPGYRPLLEAAARLRNTAAVGDRIASLPANLRPGQRDSAVAALRQRLVVNGELDSTAGSGSRYDAKVVAAVRSFQRRHGLAATGRLDSTTRAELALPAGRRFDLVAANLERYRWLPDPAESGPMLLVNLATGRLEGRVDGQLTLTGAAAHTTRCSPTTPMMADTIHGVQEVPGGIALELGDQRRVRLVSRVAAAKAPGEVCIVVPKPAAVAEFVRRTRQPVVLYLLWPTAWVDERAGRLHFRRDGSGQDDALMRVLPPSGRATPACSGSRSR